MRLDSISETDRRAGWNHILLLGIGLFGLLSPLAAPSAIAATVAHFTASGVSGLGNPQAWSGSDITGQGVAFELIMDFTDNVDSPTVPILLWEAGATGNGAALVLNGDNLHFFAGNGSDDITTGLHGLTSTTTGVQIVSVFELNAGTTDNTLEKLSIYVNGILRATADVDTANSWAGSDPGGLGTIQSGTRFGNGSPPFTAADVIDYPETNISFAVYRLASSGGSADNTLGNILVPEPSALVLMVVSGLLLLRHRRA